MEITVLGAGRENLLNQIEITGETICLNRHEVWNYFHPRRAKIMRWLKRWALAYIASALILIYHMEICEWVAWTFMI